jgi:arsenate reductase-like glutaredoxin family protein
VLDDRKTEVKEERNSRKEPLTDREARALIASVDKVIVAKGKKFEELPASKTKVANLKGPTGNYRAPMLRKGKTLLVGFHAETLGALI